MTEKPTLPIAKSKGITPTEELLAELCEKTFLKFWSYPNPYKDDHDELCDLIAIFEDHVFLFFDRESRRFDFPGKNFVTVWKRWKKRVITKQIAAAKRAEKYINTRHPIFLDSKANVPLPIAIPAHSKIHKIIVAHGAKEACARYSDENVYGSLAITYSGTKTSSDLPFSIDLNSTEKIHIFDSQNLNIVFSEFDTVWDFTAYIEAKETAIDKYDCLIYCGEEDLVAHYMLNYNEKEKAHFIGTTEHNVTGLMVGEGEWKSFIQNPIYARRNEANKVSYLWDDIIQRTCQNALDGTAGTVNVRAGKSAIHEMAKEPRIIRRELSKTILHAIEKFPNPGGKLPRNMSFMPSFYADKAYVFLQLHIHNPGDFESEYQPLRRRILEIACGSAKNRFPKLKKIIGIAIASPKYNRNLGEDFILLECETWPDEQKKYYEKENVNWKFFHPKILKRRAIRISEFPDASHPTRPNRKIGRNDLCYCGSGKKFKKCCLLKH